jgi:outer membrane biosynthesis protein TonB
VGTDGQLSDIKAVRGPSEEFNQEAIRVVSSSPRWIPGFQNGRAVKVQYTVPINFKLSFDEAQASLQNN